MNVFKCDSKLQDNCRCVFMKICINEKGEIEEQGCIKRNKDHYNLYPEFDEYTGDAIFQMPVIKSIHGKVLPSSEVFTPGTKLSWENITNQHQDGTTFDYRDFDAAIHPCYHMTEHNIPAISRIPDLNSPMDVFGNDNMSLVSGGWIDDKAYGKPNVEKCNSKLYGSIDKIKSIVVHMSMKDYTSDILDWTNYTNRRIKKYEKDLYLKEASDIILSTYCNQRFEEASAIRMFNIFKASQRGEYINILEAMINNGANREDAISYVSKISYKSKTDLYKDINIQRIYELYEQIKLLNIDKAQLNIYRSNIVNYLLNCTKLKYADPNKESYKVDERFWFAYLTIKKAITRDKLIMVENVPSWFMNLRFELLNYKTKFSLFGEIYDIKNCNQEVLDIWQEAEHYNVEPIRLFPIMLTYNDILGNKYKNASIDKKRTFNDLTRAGVKWNRIELISVWEKFSSAYDLENPRLFWSYISALDELDREELINSVGTYEGNPGEKKTCYMNLIASKATSTYDDWEVEIQAIVRSTQAGAKPKQKFKTKPPYFWRMLKEIGGLKNDKKHASYNNLIEQIQISKISECLDNIELKIIKDELQDMIHEERFAPDDGCLDSSEFENYSEFNPYTGNSSPMVSRGQEDNDESDVMNLFNENESED